jgi:hypothetical protein
MTDHEVDILLEKARTTIKEKNFIAEKKFGLGTYFRYDFNLESEKIQFSNKSGKTKVTAHLTAIGSFSETSESWMWAFENQSLPQMESALAIAMRDLATETGVDAFGAGFSPCDAALAWSLASVAAEKLQAEAVYRVDNGKSLLFLALNDIQKL